jgi:hypothetical protein
MTKEQRLELPEIGRSWRELLGTDLSWAREVGDSSLVLDAPIPEHIIRQLVRIIPSDIARAFFATLARAHENLLMSSELEDLTAWVERLVYEHETFPLLVGPLRDDPVYLLTDLRQRHSDQQARLLRRAILRVVDAYAWDAATLTPQILQSVLLLIAHFRLTELLPRLLGLVRARRLEDVPSPLQGIGSDAQRESVEAQIVRAIAWLSDDAVVPLLRDSLRQPSLAACSYLVLMQRDPSSRVTNFHEAATTAARYGRTADLDLICGAFLNAQSESVLPQLKDALQVLGESGRSENDAAYARLLLAVTLAATRFAVSSEEHKSEEDSLFDGSIELLISVRGAPGSEPVSLLVPDRLKDVVAATVAPRPISNELSLSGQAAARRVSELNAQRRERRTHEQEAES